ncbi:unnamed protein product [Orchesella dallaii]|uniref:Uncharacterized protein n=1 Tax=Orchesella dallaii TaxID=48710 RepID=A0ABP1QHH8_9HEXA
MLTCSDLQTMQQLKADHRHCVVAGTKSRLWTRRKLLQFQVILRREPSATAASPLLVHHHTTLLQASITDLLSSPAPVAAHSSPGRAAAGNKRNSSSHKYWDRRSPFCHHHRMTLRLRLSWNLSSVLTT